jgi:chromate transporter
MPTPPDAAHAPSFAEAARFWARLGCISFGGPAGQIAIMHREVVERRGWLGEREFTGALNFCMVLPGPEALQLAIYLGWKLHGIRGGLVAGLGFIVPAIVLLLALSWLYAVFGSVPAVAGVMFGLKAAVLALVLQALLRLGRRALQGPLHVVLAATAFLALELLRVPFPLIVLAAGLAGLAGAWHAPRTEPRQPNLTDDGAPIRIAATGLVLWLVPLLLVAAALGSQSLWTRVYLFMTQAALVTFGGAYAVLGYVTEHLVRDLGWLTAEQAVAGLALAETTPGPLVIVLQFMGFMAGWNQPGALAAPVGAVLAALLASWATFLPSFVFIFLGAPYVERLARAPRVAGALAGITAAVVGIIAALALLLGRVVMLPHGWPGPIAWAAPAIALAVWWMLERARLELHWALAAAALAGLAARSLGWA